jgi:transcriptional regulator NrdR family protein
MVHIIKRRGHLQEFDERKIYASVYAACLVARTDEEMAEATANLVVKQLKEWIITKSHLTSHEILKKVIEELDQLNKEASFIYRTHRDIS